MNANLLPGNRLVLLVVLFLFLAPLGCSKEELKKAYDDAKTKTEDLTAQATAKANATLEEATAKLEEVLPATGSITARGSLPIEKTGKANIEVIVIGDGRPNVVQVLSYEDDQESMSYPAVLLHGTTDANSAKSLAGSSVNCDLYMQATASGPIVMTAPGGHVAVTFNQFNSEDGTISASIAAGEVISSDETTAQFLGGELVAVVRE
jgi:hypothetical protein